VLREAEGEREEAVASYSAALADRGMHRGPDLVADVHAGMARCLLSLGQGAEARVHGDEAARLLARWPGWRRDELDGLRRRLGATAVETADTPAAGRLTPREREVALLVAEGLTNGEIARRLYIATKTASVHVSNILAKLSMSSRAQVAAWATREGLKA
jgi:DNA-binding NarL/FixJ family response regulator